MSLKYMQLAFEARVGNAIKKLILLKLADNANDDGECWPSHNKISQQCECSKSTARKYVSELEKDGFLVIENRINYKGNQSNLYRLTLDPMPRDGTGVCRETAQGMPPDDTGCAETRHNLCRETAPESVTEPNSIRFCGREVDVSSKINKPALEEYLQYRLAKNKDISVPAFQKICAQLANYTHEQQQLMVDEAIRKDWIHLREVIDDEKNKSTGRGRPLSQPERTSQDINTWLDDIRASGRVVDQDVA